MRIFNIVGHHSVVLLVRSDVDVLVTLVLQLGSSAQALVLTTDVTRVSIDDKVGHASRLIEALSSTAVAIRVMLPLVLT